MTTTDTRTHSETLQSVVDQVGPTIAKHAARRDQDGTFVHESHEALRGAGLLKAAVPIELGGGGAGIAELAAVQRRIGHYCGSTALAGAMQSAAWSLEGALRAVGDDPTSSGRGSRSVTSRWTSR